MEPDVVERPVEKEKIVVRKLCKAKKENSQRNCRSNAKDEIRKSR